MIRLLMVLTRVLPNRVLVLFSVLIVATSTFASAPVSAPLLTWHAHWLTPNGPAAANTWFVYRKSFVLSTVPSSAVARIAVDSKYWLYVNGHLVVFEGGLKRGPAPGATYFDSVELAPFLKKGENTIAVLHWFFGKDGFSHANSGRPGFIFEAKIGEQRISSDRTWAMRAHPALSTATGPAPNPRLAESSVSFDARRDLISWEQIKFDDSGWTEPSIEAGAPPVAPWGALVERPIPQWRNSGRTPYLNHINLPVISDGRAISMTLPYNAQVTPYFKVDAPEGLVIDVRTDDFMGGGAPNVHAEYITRKGVQDFEALGWMNGHHVIYSIPQGVRVLALKYRETGYAADIIGSFQSSDRDLNTLWQKARQTLSVTMRDSFMDCPDRERAQWWGDVVNELGESFYVFDSQRGPLLTRKAMHELAAWRRADGTLYSPIVLNQELPLQMLASIGHYGFATYYLYTGDLQTIKDVYPSARSYLKLWSIAPDGLVRHRAGNWDWSDWGTGIDTAVIENAWYALALKGLAEMAHALNLGADEEFYKTALAQLTPSFARKFWTGTGYRSIDYRGPIDDRAQAMAVVAGLAQPSQYPQLRAILKNRQGASPYMEKYVLEALFLMGAPDEAMSRMKRRYAAEIASPLSTLWEGWSIGDAAAGGGTINHAWSGGPLTVLSEYAAGLSPLTPGWRTWQLRPQPGSLKNIAATVPTPHGSIRFTLEADDVGGRRRGRIIVEVPAGTSAEFSAEGLGVASDKQIMIDKVPIFKKVIRLRSGHHLIIYQRSLVE